MSVYVPPSNVLSEAEETAGFVSQDPYYCQQLFFPATMLMCRRFEVAEDGIVEQPRIISGAIIDDYMQMAALSELNMHFCKYILCIRMTFWMRTEALPLAGKS